MPILSPTRVYETVARALLEGVSCALPQRTSPKAATSLQHVSLACERKCGPLFHIYREIFALQGSTHVVVSGYRVQAGGVRTPSAARLTLRQELGLPWRLFLKNAGLC